MATSNAATGSEDGLDSEKQHDLEDYLLLVLSDSALPTGGFVASSGLESFYQHGFISSTPAATVPRSFTLLSFLEESLSSYAHLNLPFFDTAHEAIWQLRSAASPDVDNTISCIRKLDADLEAMLLNHVARRASKAQGIALLALYARAFADTTASRLVDPIQTRLDDCMDKLKIASRGRNATIHGHLPICFAVLCASLGLSLTRSRHLHLFLQARAILSSAVRLNLAGPYAAQRLLLVEVRQIVNKVLQEEEIRYKYRKESKSGLEEPKQDDDENGPATTWPLGEILGARHDQLHSRIFNS